MRRTPIRRAILGLTVFLFAIVLSLMVFSGGCVAGRVQAEALPQVSATPAPKGILLLYSYGHGGKGVGIFDDGFLSVVTSAGISSNELYFEYLDLGRHEGDRGYVPFLREALLRKYSGRKIDLVLTVQQPALKFLLREGRRIAPGAPVITVQAPLPTEAEAEGRRFICQVAQFDIQGTLERALELFPKTRRVVFVSGSSESDKNMEAAAAAVAAAWKGRLEFEYTSALSMERMLQRVAGLPPDTVIIFTQYNRDTHGRVALAYEVEGKITKVANAPVFGLYDFNLSNGGIGGSVVSVRKLGETTGQLAVDILNGKLRLTRPVTALENRVVPMFDWRQIERWGGNANRLPRGSVFINRRLSVWEQYREYVLAVGVILLLQSFLIIALLIQRRRRKIAEESLRETKDILRSVLNSLPVGVWILNPDGRILEGNPAGLRIWGGAKYVGPDQYGEYKGRWRSTGKPVAPEEWGAARAIRNGETSLDEEIEIDCFDGTRKIILNSAVPLRKEQGAISGAVVVNADITDRALAEEERNRLQAQLQQAMKMEAVGRLAGGVAHDFNNLLTVIIGNVMLALEKVPPSEPVAGMLSEVNRAAERAARLTRQLLAFSRKQIIEPKLLDLNALIVDLHSMLVRLIGENIDLATVPGEGLGTVKVDPGQLEQILVNLAVNARDAMPDGGRLTIETANVELDEAYCVRQSDAAPGRFVLLAVSDTGCGMTDEVQARIFEPFFTTKEKGSGTGLGLAMTHGAVKQAGGSIAVDSEVGKGTTVRIYLPRVEGEDADPVASVPRRELPSGTETVLLVEDEDVVRNLCARVLTQLGYKVLEASGGTDAVEAARGYAERIDLLLTDVVMPGMNGNELATQLVLLHPELKVLFTSGYTDDAISRHGVLDEGVAFIGKPYTPSLLARKVREVLDGT